MTGMRSGRLTLVDMFRVADGRLVEHWDAAPKNVPPATGGRR